MQNAAGGDNSVRFDDRKAIYSSIVSNLASPAASEAFPGHQEAAAGNRRPVRLTGRA
jgi:hypothetical protein